VVAFKRAKDGFIDATIKVKVVQMRRVTAVARSPLHPI